MAQSVVYADLKFVKAPGGNSVCPRSWEAAPAEDNDAELTYENIQLAQTGEVKQGQGTEQSKEPWWSTRYLPLGLLGTCLFLLATTIGLGVRYWQVSQHLQQASRAHKAESSRLSQQVSTKEATLTQTARELEQARRELEQARRELEQARQELEQAMQELELMRQEKNSTQEQMRQQEAVLEGTKEELARVQEEKREIKEKLKQTESALSSIRPCEQTGCCLADWVLYRGKCLFISKEVKTWEESKKDCERNSARLLITKSWDSRTVPNFLKNTDVLYWIGLVQNKDSPWQWVDNSPFEKDWSYPNYRYGKCGAIRNGFINREFCYYSKPWICEKAPSQRSPARFWFP
ncbi:B-cell differentiation antigen CD72 [Dermochelys coriacea]|uniref:B-cell differentiation antigen CD72 n=1 Tax=Dermochelys coriacea TaxID=27794 RepID=UPI001CA8EAA7|nr:B-cell differentiation antigen CD72 [Dermochelys coriacea]XP_043371135.1 B-cell differentiation antigen CD72 [Dermochelys coriacea]